VKSILSAFALASLVATTLPAWSQTNSQQPDKQQIAPGGGGTSGTGVPGKPGTKSGPAVKPSNGVGMGMGTGAAPAPAGADTSGVKGVPGNKSGPSKREPSQSR
jgi:hypothetical protein